MSPAIIEHRGKKVVYTNYKDCTDQYEMFKLIHETVELFNQSNEDIVTLNDFTDTHVTAEFLQMAQQLTKEVFDKKLSKAAVLGVTGYRKILLERYNDVVDVQLVPFESKEEALEYLTA